MTLGNYLWSIFCYLSTACITYWLINTGCQYCSRLVFMILCLNLLIALLRHVTIFLRYLNELNYVIFSSFHPLSESFDSIEIFWQQAASCFNRRSISLSAITAIMHPCFQFFILAVFANVLRMDGWRRYKISHQSNSKTMPVRRLSHWKTNRKSMLVCRIGPWRTPGAHPSPADWG